MMAWSKLPRGVDLADNRELLERTVMRLIFRNGALCPSMISLHLSVPLRRVLEVVTRLAERGEIRKRIEKRLLDPLPEVAQPWEVV
jgi:hypothetical protein